MSKATTEFDRYIRLAHDDMTDAKLAEDDGIRYDDWSPEREYIPRQKSSAQQLTPRRDQPLRKSVAPVETPTRNGKKKKKEPEPKLPPSDSESDAEESKNDSSSGDDKDEK